MNSTSQYLPKKRNLLGMLGLMILTCGLYFFYWVYRTKHEINLLGGSIPPTWFIIIPFANIYFTLRYAQDFVSYALRRTDDLPLTLVIFFLLLCLPVIGIFIIQYEFNKRSIE